MSSKPNGINHSALILLIEAGAVSSANAVANGDQWVLQVALGNTKKTILAKNSGKARIWRKLDTLAKYLADLGIVSLSIDMQNYDPSQKSLTRPDSAAILKRTHEAHKSQQRQEAEPDDIVTIASKQKESPEKVRVSWEKRRAKILKQADPRVK